MSALQLDPKTGSLSALASSPKILLQSFRLFSSIEAPVRLLLRCRFLPVLWSGAGVWSSRTFKQQFEFKSLEFQKLD